MKYTKQQQKLVNHTKEKVEKLFLKYPVPAHGIGHISRVVFWIKKIAEKENAKNPFLCELSAWTHDIGRTREDNPGESSRKHHELSYIMLKEWFKDDREFDILSDKEKIELLYAVRYHWNNVADDYDTAWILRDADKLDGYGEIGLKRAKELFKTDEEWNLNLRNLNETFMHIRTESAKEIIKKEKLMEPIEKEYIRYLKSKIEPIEL